jgi:hypothetical protein
LETDQGKFPEKRGACHLLSGANLNEINNMDPEGYVQPTPTKKKRGRPSLKEIRNSLPITPQQHSQNSNLINHGAYSQTSSQPAKSFDSLMTASNNATYISIESSTASSSGESSTLRSNNVGINTGAAKTHSISSGLINTENSFGVLTDNEEEVILTKAKQDKPKKLDKIPEIKVFGLKFSDLKAKLDFLKIKNLDMKLTQEGIRVRTYTTVDFKSSCDLLKSSKVEFYTHDLPENKQVKFVLYGVPDLDISFITDSLKSQGIEPTEIRKMKLKSKRYEEEANYILYFRPGIVNINMLRKIKAVCNAICRWDYYSNSRKSPIQCHRCQKIGHGQRNCNLEHRCVICSENHPSADCPFTRNSQSADPSLLKCANCGGNHTASYISCSKKIEHMKRVQEAKSKPQSSPKNGSKPFVFGADVNNFPFLGNNRQNQQNSGFNFKNNNTTNTNNELLYSSQLKSANTNSITNRLNLNQNSSQQVNNNLFSFAEIVALTNEIVTKLRNCRTREDQFQIIMQLSIKYCYNLP